MNWIEFYKFHFYFRIGDYKIMFGNKWMRPSDYWHGVNLVIAPWLKWIRHIPGVSESKKQIYKEHFIFYLNMISYISMQCINLNIIFTTKSFLHFEIIRLSLTNNS